MNDLEFSPCGHSGTRLVYFHHVGRRIDHYTSMSKEDFCTALDLLGDAADIVDIREYLSEAGCPKASGSPDVHVRRVVLTFDDGYAETVETVAPLLEARGLTAAFFVVPSWFDRKAPHAWAPDRLWCADAASLAELQGRGHVVASHSWSHMRLDQQADGAVREEVTLAQQALSDLGLGVGMEPTLAYPYGRVPRASLEGLVSYGFATARKPTRCIRCDPLTISRVYLDSNAREGWRDAIASWW